MSAYTIIEAIVKFGLPMTVLSWLIFHWLFSEGKLGRDIRHKALKSQLKSQKKQLKNTDNKKARFVYSRWGWFGGGFYGLAGLLTFLIIELSELLDFLSAGNYLAGLDAGILNFILGFLINQLANSIQALLWFSYWPGPGESMLIWIAAGYLGYWSGIEMARRQLTPADVVKSKNKTEPAELAEVSNNEKN
jgi:hypothetical protein